MKRYSKAPTLIVLNILLEFTLLFLTYVICGLIRLSLAKEFAATFHPYVLKMFVPTVMIICAFMTGIYFVLGDYRFIHYKNTKKIFERTTFVSVFGGLVLALSIILIQGYVFSRTLLMMIVPSWIIVITSKRIFFEFVANKLLSNKIKTCNVLLIGTSNGIKKYCSGLKLDDSSRYTYVGYLAENEDGTLEKYLGDTSLINRILAEKEVDKVVISEVDINKGQLSDVVNSCSVYGIDMVIIPTYSEYLTEGQSVRKENGVYCLTLCAGITSDILGVNISVTDMEKTLEEIANNLQRWKGRYICISNVHTTVMAYDDPEYRAVQNGAVMALPDGGPLSSYSRTEGKIGARRVTGPDLMKEVLKKSEEMKWRHFFYGSSEKTLRMLREKIEKEYPGAEICGMISPPYREITPDEDERYIEMINESNPDFVWVGLGAPKQEIWMAAHKDRVNGLMIGVGAAFDYESGNLKRAPKWMQKCNLEWFYRFLQEPRRLFKRYFVTNLKFLWLTRW